MKEQQYIRSIGIDPGVRGGIACVKVGPEGEVIYTSHLWMPLVCRNNGAIWDNYREMDRFKRGQKKTIQRKLKPSEKVKPFPYDPPIQGFIHENGANVVTIERAYDGGMNRVKGASTLMHAYGGLLAIARLTAGDMFNGCVVQEVAPKTWQKQMLDAGKDSNTKELAINFCVKMLGVDLPMTSELATAKPHDGISDALVLACYGIVNVFGRDRIGHWTK